MNKKKDWVNKKNLSKWMSHDKDYDDCHYYYSIIQAAHTRVQMNKKPQDTLQSHWEGK